MLILQVSDLETKVTELSHMTDARSRELDSLRTEVAARETSLQNYGKQVTSLTSDNELLTKQVRARIVKNQLLKRFIDLLAPCGHLCINCSVLSRDAAGAQPRERGDLERSAA